MQKALLLLLALIFAVPAWAVEATDTPASPPTSPEQTQATPTQPDGQALIASTEATCPRQCITMSCPPPSGPIKVCCPVFPYSQTCY